MIQKFADPDTVTINPALAERGDLVRKLRARVQRNHVAADKWATIPDPLCQAAADEIERLRENVAELEQLHDGPLMSAEQQFPLPGDAISHELAETGRRIAELMRRTGGVCSRCSEAWPGT